MSELSGWEKHAIEQRQREEARQPPTREAIRAALLRVAENVAKHTVQRSGWTPDDQCFLVDLRAAEAELLACLYHQTTADDHDVADDRHDSLGRLMAMLDRERALFCGLARHAAGLVEERDRLRTVVDAAREVVRKPPPGPQPFTPEWTAYSRENVERFCSEWDRLEKALEVLDG